MQNWPDSCVVDRRRLVFGRQLTGKPFLFALRELAIGSEQAWGVCPRMTRMGANGFGVLLV